MKSNKKSVIVVVPCYNEGKRILPIIREAKKSRLIGEIVVVDDGSDIYTKKILKKISGVTLITHLKNRGKSEAMKTGVLNVKSDIVVFIDSDLSGFKGSYIDDMVVPIINGDLDLVLGDYEKELKLFKLSGLSVVLTGQRAVRRDLLLKNLKIFDYGGYLAEVAMNIVFFKKGRVGRVFMKGVGQIFKYKKAGLIGLSYDFNFFVKVIKMVGLRELIKQALFIRGIRRINYI
jgi:glycosyltransferase involved in cell wall biosynthesis